MNFSSQNAAAIKSVRPAKPSRAFALWLALLFLYFLLLPTAAETPDRDAVVSVGESHAVNRASR